MSRLLKSIEDAIGAGRFYDESNETIARAVLTAMHEPGPMAEMLGSFARLASDEEWGPFIPNGLLAALTVDEND